MDPLTAARPQAALRMQKLTLPAWLVIAALIVGIAAGVLFHLHPEIDLGAAGLFYAGNSVFSGKISMTVYALRGLLLITNFIIFVTAGLGLIIALILARPWLGMPAVKWLFLVICLAAGPGLVANYGFKNYWGRARPAHIVEFGGPKIYTPPLTPSGQCRRNCSFVAGEPSTIFMVFFAFALLFPRNHRKLFAVGVAAGLATGLIRMAQGAHFLSDVIFAGVAMALTAGVIGLIFEALLGPPGKPDAKAGETRA